MAATMETNTEQPPDVELGTGKGGDPEDTQETTIGDENPAVGMDTEESMLKEERFSTNAKVLAFLALGTVGTFVLFVVVGLTGGFDQ